MMDALEALYGFSMWIVKAAVAMAVVAALIAVPAYLASSTWHRFFRRDRRCAHCSAWFRDEDASLTRCRACRGEVLVPLADPVRSTGA